MMCCEVRIGGLLSIEGRAIGKDFQHKGLGTLALREILATENVQTAASVTRNPAVPRLMSKAFHIVSPDLEMPDALHHFKHNEHVRELTEIYAKHIDVRAEDVPFVVGRYGNGLYGFDDPGETMALPQISDYPGNGIIMIATEKREA